MKNIETFTSGSGLAITISGREQLEPKLGDNEALYFEISSPNRDDYSPWSCVIKITGGVLATWKLEDANIYDVLAELGMLKIKVAIKEGQRPSDFSFGINNVEATYEKEVELLKAQVGT